MESQKKKVKKYGHLRVRQHTKDKFESLRIDYMAAVRKNVYMVEFMEIVADQIEKDFAEFKGRQEMIGQLKAAGFNTLPDRF